MLLDEDRDGIIGMDEFVTFARGNNIVPQVCSEEELKEVLMFTGADNLSFGGLIAWLRTDQTPLNTLVASDLCLKNIIDAVFGEMENTRKLFAQYEDKKDRTVTIKSFEDVLNFLNVTVPAPVLSKLVKRFSKKDGRFDWLDFLRFVKECSFDTPHPEWDTGLTANECMLLGQIFEKISSRYSSLGAAFQKFDTNKDEKLDRSEFEQALKEIGVSSIKQSEVEELFNQFDKNRDGFINYREFLSTINKRYFV